MFEYMAAVELKMIRWEDVTPEQLKKYNIPHKADYGVDLISPDFTKTAQVKYYGENSSVTWRSISTYIAYSMAILKISDMTLVTTKNAKVSKMVTSGVPKILRYDMAELEPKDVKSWSWVPKVLQWW